MINCLYILVLAIGLFLWQAQAMPHFNNLQLRLKRSVVAKRQILTDPTDCIKQCLSDHTSSMSEINSRYKLKLVMKAKALGVAESPEGNEQLKQAAIDNVHDMLGEMCKRSDITKQCLEGCPKSDLQQLVIIQHADDRDQMCFPISSIDFNAYYSAENCTKNVRDKNQCAKQCGQPISVESATGFSYDEKESPVTVEYESDKAKNAAAAKKACINIKCHLDCNKALLTSQCDQNAYVLYARSKRYEPIATLASLRYLGALGPNEPSECADIA